MNQPTRTAHRHSLRSSLLIFTLLASLTMSHVAQAQWVAYTFEPRNAYRSSYGMNVGTEASASAILAAGWPTNWNNSNLRGVIALYFSTNTNSGNTVAMLPPLIYTYSTNPNNLTINNYTNVVQLAFTNTNASGSNSVNDPVSFYGRVNYGTNIYINGLLSSLLTDSQTNCMTNISASFNNLCAGYLTNVIGTNGVISGTTYLPPVLTLRLSTISRATNNVPYTNSQQLVLNLSLNKTLTQIINTNPIFGPNALTDPLSPTNSLITNCVYTNLPKCVRSNSTYINP